jgi:hypothetical protein
VREYVYRVECSYVWVFVFVLYFLKRYNVIVTRNFILCFGMNEYNLNIFVGINEFKKLTNEWCFYVVVLDLLKKIFGIWVESYFERQTSTTIISACANNFSNQLIEGKLVKNVVFSGPLKASASLTLLIYLRLDSLMDIE